jgi:hypothetical protein
VLACPTTSSWVGLSYDGNILYRLTTLVQIAGALILAAGVPRPHPLDPRTNRSANRLASTPQTGEDGDR